ncbi:hypothetical protein MVEN_00301700 [Mycena venus]|uniref:Cupredoxin n=1 Tax=Mycena venus TaxID=2733690 RepID=A0A8H7DE70_9AGAR|nr:hypothetical protein MVEN_00301700 [Mycena venus]
MFSLTVLLLAAAHAVHAFPTPSPRQITIQVGGNRTSPGGAPSFLGTTQFLPNVVLAANGTIVTFQFTGAPGNHSVTQSSFANPCQPLAGGFDSGWVSVPAGQSLESPPEWNLTITNDQIPIWFYCKQLFPVPHCHSGMVGVINVDTTNKSFPEFQDNIRNDSTIPGQAEGNFSGVGAVATGAPFIPSGASYFNDAAAAAATATAADQTQTQDGSTTLDANPTQNPNSNPSDTPNSNPTETPNSNGDIQSGDTPQLTQGAQASTQSPPSGARATRMGWSTLAVGVLFGVLVW